MVQLTGCTGEQPLLPSGERVLDAAQDAATDPATWLPAAGAIAFGVTGLDDNLADWASDETPIFGSQNNAADASDHLRDGLALGMVSTAVFAPVNGAYRESPGRRVVANGLAYYSAEETVDGLKAAVGRERPDESDDRSFPSGHSVGAFTSATLIRQNVGPSIDNPAVQVGFDAVMIGAAAATAWARIEADKHYPADVLTSAALGNFFAKMFYSALVDEKSDDMPSIQVMAEPDGLVMNVAKRF